MNSFLLQMLEIETYNIMQQQYKFIVSSRFKNTFKNYLLFTKVLEKELQIISLTSYNVWSIFQ